MTDDVCIFCRQHPDVAAGLCVDCAALVLLWLAYIDHERPQLPDHRYTHAERQRIINDQLWILAQIYTGHTPSPAAAELAHLDVDLDAAEQRLQKELDTDPIRFYYEWSQE